jgi:biopolymer transport protein ExbD
MNLRSKNKFKPEVSSSSLSDMFFLMLFFLITSTLISPSVIKLTLPKSKHHQTVRKTEVSISVTKDLKYFINNAPVAFDDIEGELLKIVKDNPEATIVLRFDNTLTVQDLVNVLQIGNKLKLKMILATKSPNG